MKGENSISTRNLLLLILVFTGLLIIMTGILELDPTRVFVNNYLIGASAISILFLIFVVWGLYRGVIIEDDSAQNLLNPVRIQKPGILSIKWLTEFISVADGLEGIILGVLLWIIFAVVLFVIIFVFGIVLWIVLFLFGSFVYLIFFRLLKPLFSDTIKCRHNFTRSLGFGLLYMFLYNLFLLMIILPGILLR